MFYLSGNGAVRSGTRADSDLNLYKAGHFMLVDNNLHRTRCPLCGAPDIGKLGVIDYFQPLNFSSKAISLEKTPELWKCKKCRSGFTQYAISEQESALLYEEGEGGERWISSLFEIEKTEEVIRVFEKVFTTGRRVLDIGCNTGELLDFAQSRGSITAGVEYSAASSEIVEAKGHVCFAAFDKVDGQYDVITAFDLVEHLYDVSSFFSKCRKVLGKNGVVIILTGNFSCFSARMTGSDWWYVRYPEHIAFPSKHYFYSLPQFTVTKWITTYAAKKFISSFRDKALSFAKGFPRGNYMALPSLVPDHVLVVLT
jgi:2-polyprenyl-3-methyl-5-hydroxy-6-metoxy-1,4-benzoquinol methylase